VHAGGFAGAGNVRGDDDIVQPKQRAVPRDWLRLSHIQGRCADDSVLQRPGQRLWVYNRSEPAIYLQEAFVIFAANFIRLATSWLASQATPQNLKIEKIGIKRQVQVGAHVSAQVVHDRR
jgi:hypothetical protein